MELVKPIDKVYKAIGMAPTQVIGPLGLDKAEQLAAALNEVFDTVEAQQLAGTEETKAKATTITQEQKAGRQASTSNAESSASAKGIEEFSTTVKKEYNRPAKWAANGYVHTRPSQICSGDLPGIYYSGWIFVRSL